MSRSDMQIENEDENASFIHDKVDDTKEPDTKCDVTQKHCLIQLTRPKVLFLFWFLAGFYIHHIYQNYFHDVALSDNYLLHNSSQTKFLHSLHMQKVSDYLRKNTSSSFQNVLYPQQDSSVVARRPSILCITRHIGTKIDFSAISELLNISYTFLHPMTYHPGYGMKLKDAETLRKEGLVKAVCRGWDAIVVIDTITDGRPFYNDSCDTKIISLVTARVDIGMGDNVDKKEYVDNLNLMRKKKKVYLVANNQFEIEYMRIRGHENMSDVPVIRPLGSSDIEEQKNVDTTFDAVYIAKMNFSGFITDPAISGLRIKTLGMRYGGPRTLAKYNAVIMVPYQVSIMKMWENLAFGVIVVIPTIKYLEELARRYFIKDILVAMEDAESQGYGDTWWKYVEFYTPEWADCFPQFDSMEDLNVLLKNNIALTAKREECKERMKRLQEYSIFQWRNVFDEVLDTKL